MYDFPSKIVMLVLIFLSAVIIPSTWLYIHNDMTQQRSALNEVTSFIDKSTDKGVITKEDVDNLQVSLNATGGMYDAEIERHMQVPTPDIENPKNNRMVYIKMDYIDKATGKGIQMVEGDLITVKAKEIGVSPAKRMIWAVLRLDLPKETISLTSMVK